MKKVQSRNRRSRTADTGTEGHARHPGKALTASARKAVSEADVVAPWRLYKRRLSAKKAHRMRGSTPNFLVIAPPKTATTWVYEILSTDRRFFIPEKECQYFSHFWREYPLASYYAQFQNPFGAVCRGEMSPSYFILPSSAIATIREEIPDAKLIVLLRDPGDRAWSHARHSFLYKEGGFRSSTTWSIKEVSEVDWCHAILHPMIRAYNEYAGALMRWAEHFPADQLLILASEAVGAQPEQSCQEIYDFLGLERPTPDSLFLKNRPNASPRITLPDPVRELLAAMAGPCLSGLDASLRSLPARLATQLAAATAHWPASRQPIFANAKLPKPRGMPTQANWDPLTRSVFPRSLLSWSYEAEGPPPDTELLQMAALNFEYNYFLSPQSETGMPDETLSHVKGLGRDIVEHGTRLSGLEDAVEALRECLRSMDTAVDQRDQRIRVLEDAGKSGEERLRNLEATLEERTTRLITVEGGREFLERRLAAIEARNGSGDQRLSSLEERINERTSRLIATQGGLERLEQRIGGIEATNALGDRRLSSLEETVNERADRLIATQGGLERLGQRIGGIEAMHASGDRRLSSLEETMNERADRLIAAQGALERLEQRIGGIEATNASGDQRLSSLRESIEERTKQLIAVESNIEAQLRRAASVDAELRLFSERHEQFAGLIAETNRRVAHLREAAARQSDRVAEVDAALAALNSTARNSDATLQTVSDNVADLRAAVEKGLYAIALLQESLRGIEEDLAELRLTRIELEFVPAPKSQETSQS